MSESTPPNDELPIRLDYRAPVRDGLKSFVENPAKLVVSVIASLILISVMASIVRTEVFKVSARREETRLKCSNHLKNIAAACITYSNNHSGVYPGDFADMMTPVFTSDIFTCPGSNDTSATGTPAQQAAALTAGSGHLSYTWLGKGVTSGSPDDTVLAYEPLTNHKTGMNVLFNDYSVRWLPAAEAQKMISSIVPGKPTIWPPPPASQP